MQRCRPIVRSLLFLACCSPVVGHAQTEEDTITNMYQLGDLVVRGRAEGLDLEGFMRQVMEDTTFYHAFLNTRCHPHRVRSALRVRNKGERETAALYRDGHLVRTGTTARLVMDSVAEMGRLRGKDGTMRYLTAEMYDDVFFPKGSWTASARIASRQQEIQGGSRFEKYKSELKKFMFNPGQEIASVPMVGDKLALFDPAMVPYYDYTIGTDGRNGHRCWLFSATAKADARPSATVIKVMHTWFDQGTMEVIAREYRIAHESLLLDFDIRIRVENAVVEGELVPTYVDYDGVWDIPFKKIELVRFYLALSDWSVVR